MQQTRLSHDQWSGVQSLALEIHRGSDIATLRELATQTLPMVVGADWSCWNEHDQRIRVQEIFVTASHTSALDPHFSALNELMDTHPVLEAAGLINDFRLRRQTFSLTDFKSPRQLRNVPIWHEIYRLVEARHQLVAQFCAGSDFGITLTVNSHSTFTEEQRTMVTLLREHFEIACRRLVLPSPVAPLGTHPILSRREREVLPHLLNGKTNPEIATILGISPRTVEKHVASILDKYGVETRRTLISLGRS